MNTQNIISHKLDRSVFHIKENEYVKYNNDIYKISSIIDFSEVIGINIKTKKPQRLHINELIPIDGNIKNDSIFKDISDIKDEEFVKLQEKYLAIQPLLNDYIGRKEIEEHSKKLGIHFTTLYRWIKQYKSTGTLVSLLSKPTGRKKEETRLDFNTEKIMQEIIQNHYLSKQKPSVQSTINKITDECLKKNITPPSKNTVRNRIHKLSEYEVLKKRGSESIARTKFLPVPGKFEKSYPFQLIQIDHTKVDTELVDDEHRKNIGRPYITVAIDVYSRMIVGYYLSLNPPSVTSVALCITNSILPKEKLLMDLDINTNWDVWGFPETIHVDNGADFRSESLKHSGLIYGINIEFRPIKKTHFGGHIESVIKTLMKATHEIPGTTFSNIQQKGEYDSSKNASMTFSEFEKWLVTFITKIYHKRIHSEINMTPEQLWEIGLFGGDAPIGLLPKPSNPQSILIDFLPLFTRTIQKNGVNIDGINYYDNLLRSRINLLDKTTGKKKKFIFKRDPRNIKYVWFYDDTTKEYYKINAADQSLCDITLWEYNLIKKTFSESGIRQPSALYMMEAREELNRQIDNSVKKTKKARREQQRLKNKNKEINKENNFFNDTIAKDEPSTNISDVWEQDIPDFG